eukprot:CAMPEP_0194494256 /NCGR_PEP_ID=MMETSP0253-20130528/12218_1 /TAXON_ID=2966 /ORGANISM="Noctiluca scintillans" /LENGTH=236 /DNA_ID=CAMNT_0039335351 /DNA_START=62 /DNA_END=772 /DNA_ORIENTATION=-
MVESRPRIPSDPVDTAGMWVPRDEFPGRKSVGFFVCACGTSWTRAGVQKNKRECCQACGKQSFATRLWFDIAAPVDSPGRWVPRDEFRGRKSFGFFVCTCGNRWKSAHAQPKYRQGCQRCEQQSLAMCLWYNEGPDTRPERETDDDKPHDSARCEACKHGDCKIARNSLPPRTPVPGATIGVTPVRSSARASPEHQARAPVQAASSGVTSTARASPEPRARAPVQPDNKGAMCLCL